MTATSTGSKTLGPGDETPWGPAQDVQRLAPGISLLSTHRHGGLHLSIDRRADLPKKLRLFLGENAEWWEEDCEIDFALWYFYDALELSAITARVPPRAVLFERCCQVVDAFPEYAELWRRLQEADRALRDMEEGGRADAAGLSAPAALGGRHAQRQRAVRAGRVPARYPR